MSGPPAGAEAGATRTPLLEFVSRAPFRFQQPNASQSAAQQGRAGERHFTTSEQFANQVLVRQPQQFRIMSQRSSLPCVPRELWPDATWEGESVLFLLPSQALGNNVSTLLFLEAFMEHRRPRAAGVFCARSTTDIYLAARRRLSVYPLWIGERELARWTRVVDLGHLESRRNIEIWPVDMEADLLQAFALPPASAYPAAARRLVPRGRPSIGVLPLASSPLRTLPPSVGLALVEGLAPLGEVTLCLNKTQRQGVLYAEALAGRLPAGTRVIDAFATIGELLAAVRRFDYAVFADSGPAHMSKLFATPGVAVYSSAPGDVLQGRFRNLAGWTIPFQGPYCACPCGLAKVRKTSDGRIGCMGSLGVALEALPAVPGRGDAAVVERLQRDPVPCLASLAADPEPLVDFVRADLAARLAGGTAAGDAQGR